MSVCLIVFFFAFFRGQFGVEFYMVLPPWPTATSPVILAWSLVEKIKKLQARELLPLIIEICESATEGTDDN